MTKKQKIIDWFTNPRYRQIGNTLYRNGKPFAVCGLDHCNHKHCIDIGET